MVMIFIFSTEAFSTHATFMFFSSLAHLLSPDISDASLSAANYFIRIMAHIAEYAILSLLWYRALNRRVWRWSVRSALVAFLCSAIFALSDEYHQSFVLERSASFVDVGIDTLGAGFTQALIRVILK